MGCGTSKVAPELADAENSSGGGAEVVTYHDPCHLKKSMGVSAQPRSLVRASGKKLVEMSGSDKCCGMGGSFNVYHYDLSASIGQIKQENITATGADPLAATDNLNFGNPEKPESMGQLVGAIKGIGEACRALDFPIVSGNVSLYNETSGEAILPTPAIGGVGLLDDVTKRAGAAFANEGDVIVVVGGHGTHLGQSAYLRDILGREDGAPPPVDLDAERRRGDFVRDLIRAGRVTGVHDVSSGGLAVALAEMAIAGGTGARVKVSGPAHAALFGEDQGRYVLTIDAERAGRVVEDAIDAGLEIVEIGHVGGSDLTVEDILTISVAKLGESHETWFPTYMAGA